MSSRRITVEGGRELRKALRAVENGTADLKGVHKETGELVGATAARLVPRRKGVLQSTIRAAGQAAGAVVRAGYAVVPYAGPIHFGWPSRGIAPTPFLYDALDYRRAEVIEMYQDRVNDLIRKHGLD